MISALFIMVHKHEIMIILAILIYIHSTIFRSVSARVAYPRLYLERHSTVSALATVLGQRHVGLEAHRGLLIGEVDSARGVELVRAIVGQREAVREDGRVIAHDFPEDVAVLVPKNANSLFLVEREIAFRSEELKIYISF